MAGKKDLIKDSERFSIITDKLDVCYICGAPANIHEIFHGTANRKKSKEDGCTVPLCKEHHQGKSGVHNDAKLDIKFKQIGEKYWIEKYTDKSLPMDERINQFIFRYGINYLE